MITEHNSTAGYSVDETDSGRDTRSEPHKLHLIPYRIVQLHVPDLGCGHSVQFRLNALQHLHDLRDRPCRTDTAQRADKIRFRILLMNTLTDLQTEQILSAQILHNRGIHGSVFLVAGGYVLILPEQQLYQGFGRNIGVCHDIQTQRVLYHAVYGVFRIEQPQVAFTHQCSILFPYLREINEPAKQHVTCCIVFNAHLNIFPL